jgi:hypothetical protein
VYKNRAMKPIEIVLWWWWGWGRMMEGVNLIDMHDKHICKCHNETPLYN